MGGGGDSGRFQVSKLSQAQWVVTRKSKFFYSLNMVFSNTVPSTESLRSKISLEEKEENINLRLNTPPPRRKKFVPGCRKPARLELF